MRENKAAGPIEDSSRGGLNTETLTIPGGAALVRAVVLHELGHVVGLAHVDDARELMYRDNVGQTSFGSGDLAGLAALGRGRCVGQG